MSIPGSSQIRSSFLDFFRGKDHTIVPSSSLLPDSPNLLFTNAGMNQFVPYFLGEEKCPFRPARAADTQKCIRAGGKHNDLDDVGMDTYHHTFFEMLGNWSFGDYFKAEAIGWAWELVVECWGFPAGRLYATVYEPGEGDPGRVDEEARELWSERFRSVGLDPAVHVVAGGHKDNFWMMGETGPCGPCSELHMDLTPSGDTAGVLVNADDPRCIEIWNLVFIEFNADADGGFSALPQRHVDTGMGFERVVSIIQGTEGFRDFSRPVSNYATDIFRPLFDRLEALSGRTYGGSHVSRSAVILPGSPEAVDVAFRVMADHIRTLCFSIGDGILPGNTDRNYVLRRILRRALRYGRSVGLEKPFFHELAGTVSEHMGDVFPELIERLPLIREVILNEEESFNRTLDRGILMFEQEAAGVKQRGGGQLSGEFSFKLYDEQGFPLDLTELMARERGLKVDVGRFEELMEEQRGRARAAQKREVIEASDLEVSGWTVFDGYDRLEMEATVSEVTRVKGQNAVILDRTPFYPEMGGQVGDTGTIGAGERRWTVSDTRKVGGMILHFLEPGSDELAGVGVCLSVDRERRLAVSRHHTATHLLHWALHEVVSPDATQKGSFVGPEKLTFDFNSPALTPAQVRDVEHLVNERLLENNRIHAIDQSYQDVRTRNDIQQAFGEKYGETVRVVQIGGAPGALDGFSMELCGGTHVRQTGELGLFRILSEGAVSAGVRRIEAIAGFPAHDLLAFQSRRLDDIASTLNCPVAEVEKKLTAMVDQMKSLEKSLREASQREARQLAAKLESTSMPVGSIPAILADLGRVDAAALQAVLDALKASFDGVVVLATRPSDTQVSLGVAVSTGYTGRVQAGKVIAAIAPCVGGKGGGRPDLARGGGKDPAGIPIALEEARKILATA